MSHNIDVLKQYDILQSAKLFYKNREGGQYVQYSDNQVTLTETSKMPITIVFWDISAFSRLAKTFYELDQEALMLEFLEKYYRTARRVITKNNGVWDKAIGDGIMSWFGSFDYSQKKAAVMTKTPITKITKSNNCTNDEGALDAVTAAIELRNCFKCLKAELINKWATRLEELSTLQHNVIPCKGKKKTLTEHTRQGWVEEKTTSKAKQIKGYLTDFDLKCGINTGSARVCLLYNQLTAFGTNVNFASRLQEFVKIDQILIATSTERKIRKENLVLRKIVINSNNPRKSFEDIDCCYEII